MKEKDKKNVPIWLAREEKYPNIRTALENASRIFDNKDAFTVSKLIKN